MCFRILLALVGAAVLQVSATAAEQRAHPMVSMQFPNDDNGQVLRQMAQSGDDLSKPRMIEFQHIFTSKENAIAFVGAVSNETDRVELSWFEGERSWNVQVARFMVPTYRDITALELALGAEAKKYNGKSDGWGCMEVKSEK
jgi:hypothetical protein